MTSEEAWRRAKGCLYDVLSGEEADEIIKALEKEPCEDCISREDALQALCKAVHKNDDAIPCLNQRVSCLWNKTKVQDYAEEILKLPPVTPAEKVGQWIPVSERLPEEYKEVIVTDIETSDTYQSRYIGNGYWECDNGLFMNRIIAWMPKPKPYVPDINVSKKSASPTGEGEE